MDLLTKLKERAESLSIEVVKDADTLSKLQAQVMMKRGALAELSALIRQEELSQTPMPQKTSKGSSLKSKALRPSKNKE